MPRGPDISPLPGIPVIHIADDPGTLVAADPHLGFEGAMNRNGIYLPPRSLDPAGVLVKAAVETGSRRIVLLGDVKHRLSGPTVEEGFDIKGFFRKLTEVVDRVDVCPGNHDGGLADALVPGVELHGPRGFLSGDVGFWHGHTWPDPALFGGRRLLMGHTHPTVWFLDHLSTKVAEQCWLRARLSPRLVMEEGIRRRIYPDPKKTKKGAGAERTPRLPPPRKRLDLIVIPALSPYGSGCAVNHPRVPLLGPMGRPGLVDIDEGDVYLLSGVHLGKVKDLPAADEVAPGPVEVGSGCRTPAGPEIPERKENGGSPGAGGRGRDG
jgi:metallophosphoesterase superfamily enzyme